jgi:hypothetical protein
MASNLMFDRKKFFDGYRTKYGKLNQSQVVGLSALLDGIEQDSDISDARWVAYMLATVKHECADQYHPIPEFRAKAGSKGRANQDRYWLTGYYGRGYVQLTWDYNYKNVGKGLGMGDDLFKNPALALDPSIAYKVMSFGMRNGTFTTKKLADYISGEKCDYINARRIINGTNKASLIAGYAADFEKIASKSQTA